MHFSFRNQWFVQRFTLVYLRKTITLIWLKHFDLEIIYDYLYAINYKLYKIYTYTELHILVEYTNPKSKNSTWLMLIS